MKRNLPAAAFGLMLVVATMSGARAATVNLPAGAIIDGTIQQQIDTKYAEEWAALHDHDPCEGSVDPRPPFAGRAREHRSAKAHVTLNLDTIPVFRRNVGTSLSAEIVGVTQEQDHECGSSDRHGRRRDDRWEHPRQGRWNKRRRYPLSASAGGALLSG